MPRWTSTYRLLLRVTGTSPVAVYTRLDVRSFGGGWSKRGETGYVDNDSERIQTAGAAGFSGDLEAHFTYDNFSRVGY